MSVVLSIITVNYNGLGDTCALIDSIASDDSVEVIVVDNGSSVDESQEIARRYPQVRTIRSDRNLGFAGGNNLGLHAARGRYLLLINNDTFFEPYSVEPLIRRLESSDKIGMVCPKLRFAWDDRPIQFAGYTPLSAITLRNSAIGYGEADNGQYQTPHPTPYAHGAAMMVRRDALERVGLMPECYFLYYEELDWSLMFTRAGYEIWYEPASTVYHKESRTTGADSPLKTYYVTRNRLLFARRNYGLLQRLGTYAYLTCLVVPRDVCRHLSRRRPDLVRATLRAVADFYFKPFNSQNASK